MKLYSKIATVFAAAALMLGVAGNAMAYFETSNRLVRVVYDLTKSTERVTDLGDINTIIANTADGADIYGAGSNSFLAGTLASSSMSNLNVAYFAVTISNNDLWLASNNATQDATYTQWNATKSGLNSMLTIYRAAGTQTVEVATSAASSYYTKMDGVGTKVGSYNNLIPVGAGEINLATLATSNPLSMNLFFWDNPGTLATKTGTITGLNIITLADGSTMVETAAAPVPIPPAFFLMGSGLLGMIGLRRRMA